MADKLPHRCNFPRCPALTHERYCKKHAKQRNKQRGSAHERGYTARWQKASKDFLREHPLCECDECKRSAFPLPSEVVDHIIPHDGDYERFWDTSNWMAMAKAHHDRKTAKEDGGFGRARIEKSSHAGEEGDV